MQHPKWSPEIDNSNRLDAINPDIERAITDKPHMKIMDDIRSRLKQSLNEIPDCPDVSSMDELFIEAEKVVNTTWKKHVSELFKQNRTEWIKQTEGKEEYKELHEILLNDKVFEQNLRLYQLGPLEQLRSLSPEGWYKLVLASSERQLAQIWLLNHWLKESKDTLPSAIGMTQDEIKLILEIGSIFAKYFNIAFLKQTELADTPGGSSKTPIGDKPGGSRLYEMYADQDDQESQIKTFGEVFEFEWQKIVKHLKTISAKTEKLIEENKIPESYKGLPDYLSLLASVYGSEEKDPEKLIGIWENLDQSCKELAESGCPISIIGQAVPMVAGDANKVDIELRVGLRNEEAISFEKKMETFHNTAQKIVDSKAGALSSPFSIPEPKVTRQIFFFGTNLVWETPADTRRESTNIHYNTIEKEGMAMKTILDKLLPKNKISDDEYKNAFVIDTSLHELGHGILPIEDNNILARIGISSEADIMEEIKAETMSFAILRDSSEQMQDTDIMAQVMAKISVLIDYLLNKSSEEGSASERYYYTGIAIVKELLEKGAIKGKDGIYEISNPRQIIDIIADMGNEVIREYYENTDSNPEAVGKRIKELRQKKSDPEVVAFLGKIKNIQKF